MFRSLALAAALTGVIGFAPPTLAQTLSRAQVQMDRDTFLNLFQWDELNSQWVMKDGMPMPKGIKSRAEIMAMTADFLRMNRWDESNSEWVPNGGKPRDMSTLTRDQVHMETVRFLMTHRYDEASSEWISKLAKR